MQPVPILSPCDLSAESALQAMIWYFQSYYSDVYYFPEECFFTDATGPSRGGCNRGAFFSWFW